MIVFSYVVHNKHLVFVAMGGCESTQQQQIR